MFQITKQQLDKRWDALPINLREILCSPDYGKIIWQIGKENHLIDEKIGKIAGLCGDVILGFLHPEDLASEIKKDLNLIPELANLIASEVDRKIFTSIRSEIEKVYSPVSEGEAEADLRGDEIASPSARNDDKGEAKEIQYKEVEPPLEVQPPKIEPEPPIRIIGMEEETKPTTNNQQPSEIPRESALSPRESAPEEGPMIIHEETELKPLSESKKSFKSLGGLFGFLSASRRKKEKPEEIKPVRAEVEGAGFSKEIKEIIKEFKPIETKIKVVDYAEVPEVLTDNLQPTTDDNNTNEPEPPIRIKE